MFQYVVRRTIQAVPLLLLITIILFSILHAMPGGPLGPYLQKPGITQADIKRLEHNFGLDRPVYVQYLAWLGRIVLHGDFGYSNSNSENVSTAILERLPATLQLTIAAFLLALLLGVGAGLYAAIRPYSLGDYFVTTFAFFGQSMPVFWFGLMLQLGLAVYGLHAFGYELKLPSAGRCGDVDPCGLGEVAKHLIMPVIVLSLLQIALYSRFMRSSMLEVVKTDYMRTASAKGLDMTTVIFKHGLKNAFIPVVTVIALALPGIMGGAVVTETIFAWPGMGRLFYQGLLQQDFALLMGYLMIIATLVVFFNLLADVAYAWLDPRVKYD